MQKRYLLLSVFVLGAFLGFAQHENILPASVEKMKMDWLWEKTTLPKIGRASCRERV